MFSGFDIHGESIMKRYQMDVPKLMQAIENHAKPAPFGKGSETVIDPNVRNATEIPAEVRAFNSSYSFDRLCNLLDKSCPPGKRFEFELYKIHIYKEGGHLEVYQDTLHSEKHYATLVIGLAGSEYTGGDFILTVKGQHVKANTQQDAVMPLTDIPHRVEKVTSGTRVTFQFDVYLEDFEEKDAERTQDTEESEMEDEYVKVASLEAKGIPIKRSRFDDEETKEELVQKLDSFLQEHPEYSVSILLLHQYPRDFAVDCLRASDCASYELANEHFDVNIRICINQSFDDKDGSKEQVSTSIMS
ncbi:hypothetical protein EDD86DRAFT_134269 [Gorgonomyces haynaldii]|nr:hypothetical protein EDD86DRAFT_134269 [Gorgonomyces haynaldii]